MIVTIAAALAAHLGAAPAPAGDTDSLVHRVRGGWCSHGYDIDIYGRCYPNGVIPPQYQAARQYRGYGAYGRYGGPYRTTHGSTVGISHMRRPASANRRAVSHTEAGESGD